MSWTEFDEQRRFVDDSERPMTIEVKLEGPGDCTRCLRPMSEAEAVKVWNPLDPPLEAIPELGIEACSGYSTFMHERCADPAPPVPTERRVCDCGQVFSVSPPEDPLQACGRCVRGALA